MGRILLMFKCDPNSNSQCRWRLRDPKEFESVWTEYEWKDLKNKGISYIVGIDNYDKKSVQAIRFDRKYWSESVASKWWDTHKNEFKKTWTQKDWAKWKKQKKSNLGMVTNMEKAGYISWNDSQIKYIDGTFSIETDGKFTVLDEYEFIEYMEQHGENTHDIKDMVDMLKEEYKSVALRKYAAGDYLRFETGASIQIYVDDIDLAIKPEIEEIKKSDLSLDDKVVAVKKVALAEATAKLEELIAETSGITISYGDLELNMDNMDWYELLTPEEGE